MTITAENPITAEEHEPPAVARELVELDPAGLLIDRNIRDAQIDRALIGSIKAHGVLVAITAVRTTGGAVRVRYGHRRTLAAIEAGRPTVPVWIVGAEDDDDTDRLLSQWAENEHRTGLTDAERVGAVEQLAAFGLTAGQIARRLHAPRRTVDAAITAAASEVARAAVARYDFLTIEQAATVAAFDTDTEAVTALVAAAKLGTVQFARAEAKARQEAEDCAKRAEALASVSCPVVEPPAWSGSTRRLDRLIDGSGAPLTPQAHESCPGAVAWLDHEWSYPDDGDDSDAPAELVYVLVHGCTDPDQFGHTPPAASRGHDIGGTDAAADDEAAKEAKRAERRKVIEGNRAWRAAEPIRHEWLRTLLARKTAPKGSAALIAAAIAEAEGNLNDGREMGAKLLGLDGRASLARAAATATEGRAQVINLAMVLGGYEAGMGVQTWRQSKWGQARVVRYFQFIEANGYPLDQIERTAAGMPKPKKGKDAHDPAADAGSVEQDEVAA